MNLVRQGPSHTVAIEDEGFLRERADGDPATFRQRMIDPHDHEERLPQELRGLQCGRQNGCDAAADDGDLLPPFQQSLRLLMALDFIEDELDVGIGLAESQDRVADLRQKGRRRKHGDAKLTQLAAFGTHGNRDRPVGPLEYCASFGKKEHSRLSQLDAPIGPVQQARGQRSFQQLDLLAERRLRDPKTRGGAAEMKLFGQRNKIADAAELHSQIISNRSQ